MAPCGTTRMLPRSTSSTEHASTLCRVAAIGKRAELAASLFVLLSLWNIFGERTMAPMEGVGHLIP